MVERKACFILEAGNEETERFMSKGELAPANQWARVFINKGEFQRYIEEETATCTIAQSVLTDMWWSDHSHFHCFK